MRYFTSDKLLTYSPKQALIIGINDVVGTSLHPDLVIVSKPTLVNGLPTVTVTAIDDPTLTHKKIVGSGQVTLKRYKTTDLFGLAYRVKYDGSIHTKDVLAQITKNTGIVFDDDDFEDTLIVGDTGEIQAKAESLRWEGRLVIIQGSGEFVPYDLGDIADPFVDLLTVDITQT